MTQGYVIDWREISNMVEKKDLVGENKKYQIHIFYKQLHFRPPEPKIFENRSNLASNCRASNRKFLATFEPPIRNS